jgi:hypothetical protein
MSNIIDQLLNYRIYCNTESKYVTSYSKNPPTTCINNVGHSVNLNTVQVVKEITNTPYSISLGSTIFNTGTITQASNTVTHSATGFLPTMAGGILFVPSTDTKTTIVSVDSTSQLTVSSSATIVSATIFFIYYGGVQSDDTSTILSANNMYVGNEIKMVPTISNRKIILRDDQFPLDTARYHGLGLQNSQLTYNVPSTSDHVFNSASSANTSIELFKVIGAGGTRISKSPSVFDQTLQYRQLASGASTITVGHITFTGSMSMVVEIKAFILDTVNAEFQTLIGNYVIKNAATVITATPLLISASTRDISIATGTNTFSVTAIQGTNIKNSSVYISVLNTTGSLYNINPTLP